VGTQDAVYFAKNSLDIGGEIMKVVKPALDDYGVSA